DRALSPEAGVGANPKSTGSGSSPHRSARGVTPHRFAHASFNAVALVAPVRLATPHAGPVVAAGHEVFMSSSPGGLRFSSPDDFSDNRLPLTTPGTSWRRTPPACATAGRRSGRSSLPGWRGPSS